MAGGYAGGGICHVYDMYKPDPACPREGGNVDWGPHWCATRKWHVRGRCVSRAPVPGRGVPRVCVPGHIGHRARGSWVPSTCIVRSPEGASSPVSVSRVSSSLAVIVRSLANTTPFSASPAAESYTLPCRVIIRPEMGSCMDTRLGLEASSRTGLYN